jgi:hypothetical protein
MELVVKAHLCNYGNFLCHAKNVLWDGYQTWSERRSKLVMKNFQLADLDC